MSNNVVSRLKRKKIEEAIEQGKRMDGRAIDEYRDLEIKPEAIEKAEGSAEVRLGKTHVIVGIKVEEGTPFEDTPDAGVLICNAEFSPVAHPTWEPGPPGEGAVELARVIDRGLRSAEILDLEDLALVSGEKVLMVFVDLHVLNYDGNLIDASAAGALAALMKSKKPVYNVKKGKAERTDEWKELNLLRKPVAVTLVKIGENWIVDPTADEEEVMDTRLTVTLDEEDNVTTLQKSGTAGLKLDEIKEAINIAVDKAKDVRSIVEDSVDVE
ncbi:MAG: exosome complex protein Rrp42 [Candidatus Bathyarchaeia archaeon]